MRTNLYRIAHGRSGDKGDTVNVGVIARGRSSTRSSGHSSPSSA
jgi:hypothetical protein